MSDPANADKILATLAERAAKRRSTTPSITKKVAPIRESSALEDSETDIQEQEIIHEEKVQQSKAKDTFEEDDNVVEDIQEEYDKDEEYLDEDEDVNEDEEYIEPLRERPHRMERIVKANKKRSMTPPPRKSSNLNSSNRYYNKPLNRKGMYSPENCSSFEEQVDVVGNLLYEKLSAYQGVPALRLTQDWIDCIVDDNDSIYDDVYDKLISLNKEQLLGYIRILVSALK